MLDIDNFKQVNDTYGHQQGDVVLRDVARVLRESSRAIDLPARYGGEELAVVLPGTDLEGAYDLAERVREGIEALEFPLEDENGERRRSRSRRASARLRWARASRICASWWRPPTPRCTGPSAPGRTRPSGRASLLTAHGTARRRHP